MTKTDANKFAARLVREGQKVALMRTPSSTRTSGYCYRVLRGDDLVIIEALTEIANHRGSAS